MTLNDTYQEFLITQQLRGNSEKTIEYYTNCLLPFLKYAGSDTNILLLNAETLKEYALTLHNRGLASNSIKTYTKGIKAFLNWLYEEEYTVTNLSDILIMPKAQRKTIDTLTDTELKKLFGIFNLKKPLELRNCCICALMVDSGLRKSEVIRLSVDDVHILEGYCIINGKGNKQRIVPLGNYTKKYLIKYMAQRPKTVEVSALFLTKQGKPITESVIERLFKTLKNRQDLLTPRIHAHLLRHTFATNYLENGGNIYNLKIILGHSSLDMVKRYVHLAQEKTVLNFKNYSPLDNIKR